MDNIIRVSMGGINIDLVRDVVLMEKRSDSYGTTHEVWAKADVKERAMMVRFVSDDTQEGRTLVGDDALALYVRLFGTPDAT